MKTQHKNFVIEIDHDIVWGYNWTITKPTGMLLTSEDVVPYDISSSWRTENDALQSARDLINLMVKNEPKPSQDPKT